MRFQHNQLMRESIFECIECERKSRFVGMELCTGKIGRQEKEKIDADLIRRHGEVCEVVSKLTCHGASPSRPFLFTLVVVVLAVLLVVFPRRRR